MAGRARALRIATILASAGLCGVLVFGAHPYITNFLRDGHPLYPLFGAGHVDIMTGNRPASLRGLSEPARLWASYFSPTSTSYDGVQGQKAPFTFQRSEFRAAGEYDPRLAGFGPFFSGAALIALGLSAWIAFSAKRTRASLLLLAFALALSVSQLVMPESWWARYVAPLWWSPVLVIVAAWFTASARIRAASWALVAVLALNSVIVTASSALYAGGRSFSVHRQIDEAARGPHLCVFLGSSYARAALFKTPVTLSATPLEGLCAPHDLAAAFPAGEGSPALCPCTP
jgi:hypothetical protein